MTAPLHLLTPDNFPGGGQEPPLDTAGYRKAFTTIDDVLEYPEGASDAITELADALDQARGVNTALAVALDALTHGFVPGEWSAGLCRRCGAPESVRLHQTSTVITARAGASS